MTKTLLVAALLALNIPRALEAQSAPVASAEEKWWRTFADPELDRLIECAVQNNLDLQLSTERLLEARASRGIAGADLFPSVGLSTPFQRLRGGFQDQNVHLGSSPGASSLIAPFET